MTTCTNYQSLIIQVAGGAAGEGDRLRLEQHLDACEACTSEYKRLVDVVSMASPQRVDPGDAFWDSYYSQLMERLESEQAPSRYRGTVQVNFLERLTGILTAPKWALQLAAALVLITSGVLMGRTFFAPSPDTPVIAGLTEGAQEDAALATRANAYLDRSKTLLLGLVNFDVEVDDPSTLNFERRQAMAGELVIEAGLLQDELSAYKQRQLRELISDLEIILLQIANIESAYDVPEIEMVQSGVDRKAILFKIEVEEMRRFDDAMKDDVRSVSTPSI